MIPGQTLENYTGCFLGGAVGDALGAPTEFMSLQDIIQIYGPDGVSDYVEFPDGRGEITDDTQMVLFTAEAILQAYNPSINKINQDVYYSLTFLAYLRWFDTQNLSFKDSMLKYKTDAKHGGLVFQKEMYKYRVPGNSCLTSLEETSQSGRWATVDRPVNNSKGCGGIMRIAPVGLINEITPENAFRNGVAIAAMTHGHPEGYLPAGVLACIIACIRNGDTLRSSIERTLSELTTYNRHENTEKAILQALRYSENESPTFENVERLGKGWVGEEALSISLFCALHYSTDFEKGVLLAVNHSGDTDSTGAITGNILGLLLGEKAIPQRWIQHLNMEPVIRDMATQMFYKI